MSPNDMVTLGLVVLAILPLLHFVYRYHRYSPWRSTPEGKNMMGQKVAMVLLFLLIFFGRLFGPWPGREIVTPAFFAILVFFFYNTDRQLIYIQKTNPPRDNWKLWWSRRRARKAMKKAPRG